MPILALGAHGDQSRLEAIDRRYAWIKRNLKAKEEMWGVFPPQWRVPQLLCMSLCKLTRTHMLIMLDTGGRVVVTPGCQNGYMSGPYWLPSSGVLTSK